MLTLILYGSGITSYGEQKEGFSPSAILRGTHPFTKFIQRTVSLILPQFFYEDNYILPHDLEPVVTQIRYVL